MHLDLRYGIVTNINQRHTIVRFTDVDHTDMIVARFGVMRGGSLQVVGTRVICIANATHVLFAFGLLHFAILAAMTIGVCICDILDDISTVNLTYVQIWNGSIAL